jgi:hypothetical protein
MMTHSVNADPSHAAKFATTRWRIVNFAGCNSSPDSRVALEALCQAHWFPLYAYVRRRVTDVEEAHDLTRAFFAQLLEKNYIAKADSVNRHGLLHHPVRLATHH